MLILCIIRVCTWFWKMDASSLDSCDCRWAHLRRSRSRVRSCFHSSYERTNKCWTNNKNFMIIIPSIHSSIIMCTMLSCTLNEPFLFYREKSGHSGLHLIHKLLTIFICTMGNWIWTRRKRERVYTSCMILLHNTNFDFDDQYRWRPFSYIIGLYSANKRQFADVLCSQNWMFVHPCSRDEKHCDSNAHMSGSSQHESCT